MSDQEVLDRAERAAMSVDLRQDRYEDLLRRRDRKRRNRRITAGVVGIAVFVAVVWIVRDVASLNRTRAPVVPESRLWSSPPRRRAPSALFRGPITCSTSARAR